MWKNISIRFRLSILYGLLLVTLLSFFSYGIFIDTKKFLIQNTSVRLRAQAKPVIEKWLYPNKENMPVDRKVQFSPNTGYLKKIAHSLAVDLTSRDTAALVLDEHGRILSSGRRLKEEPLPVVPNPSYYNKSLSGNNDISYIAEKNNKAFLVVLIPLRKAPGSSVILGAIQLNTSLIPIERILARQKAILVIGIIFIFIIGALIGLWITSASLKELGGMVLTCNQIADGDLGKRINLPKRRDEIGQLANAFDNMITRIKELFDTQNRFVANAAHELRTPLTAIQGSLEVLMRGAQDDPAASARLAQGMYREVTRLTRMCEQLLDLARTNSPRDIRRERVNIKSVIEDFTSYAGIIAEGRKIMVNSSSDIYFFADPDSFKQVLFNLTDNAIQHTEQEGVIEFGWEQIGNNIKIYVADNGSGIDPADIPKIFEPFYRGDPSRSRRQGGTGLGLTIVKAIVEANDGRIEVESRPNEKTVFTITFPVS